MPPADPIGVLDALREGDLGPLYWIYGEERFLVDRAVALIKQRGLDPRTRDFNYDLFWAKEAGPQKILGAARTLPMMAKRRVLIVRDADAFKADDLEALLPYVAAPCPETILAFVAEKVDQRFKFFTTFKKRGVLLKCDPVPDRMLAPFVRGEGQARGLRFDAGAAETIADEVGSDLGQLCDAVERLELYAGARKAVTVADVEEVVSTTRQRTVFELTDALGLGDTARALTALGSLQGAGEPALKTLAMVARHVRDLLAVRDLLDRRVPKRDFYERLRMPSFRVDKLEEQARSFDGQALRAMHRAVYRTDRTLKGPRVDDERVMELLVLELLGKRPRRATARGR